jgi:S-adenosylmethionine-diacylgycerolhomoserine-N-methlytransferase
MTDRVIASTVSHSRLMDRVYRRQRHVYDMTRKYYLLGRDRLIHSLDLSAGQSLLEVGCGTGRNLAVAAGRYPDARLYGLDISSEMLATARRNLEGQPAVPVLILGDAANYAPADFGIEGFDRIMISYALSMIPEWEKTIAVSLDALNPGGSLHIADFGQQERLPKWFGRLLRAWLAQFHVTPRADLESVLRRQAEARGFVLSLAEHVRGYAWLAVVRRDSP